MECTEQACCSRRSCCLRFCYPLREKGNTLRHIRTLNSVISFSPSVVAKQIRGKAAVNSLEVLRMIRHDYVIRKFTTQASFSRNILTPLASSCCLTTVFFLNLLLRGFFPRLNLQCVFSKRGLVVKCHQA